MNLFENIFNKKTQQAFLQAGQAIKQSFQPLTDYGTQTVQQNVEDIKPAIQPIKQAVTKIAEPIVKPIQRQNKVNKVNDFIASKGLTLEHIKELARMDGTDPEEAIQSLHSLGIKVQGMEEQAQQEQAIAQQIPQGEDLGFFGSIKEGGIGAFRSGEQIPRIIGSGLGYVGEKIGEGLDVITPGLGTGSKELGQRFQQIGSDITMAGMTDGGTNPLTQKQISARQTGGELALTAPIGGGYLAGAKGVGGLALRSGVVGAGFGATQPIIDKGGQATVGDIATGGLVGGVTGAVTGPIVGLAGKGIVKGAEMIKRKINPSKFVQQIDDETVNLVRKAVRPSITGVDSVGKFDIQDEKLLQGVKEVVKQGKKPKNARELMESISDTKKAIWNKVEKVNKAVVKKTNGSEISEKVKGIVNDPEYDELFANNPSLESELLRFADDVVTNKRFQNLSQEKLQNYLVDINGRLPQTAFQKSLASNPTQTAKDTLIAKVYKDILDDNLEVAVGMAGKETRQAYGAVRQLEKDFAKRYGVYLRQNPQGLADMFGMEGFADMAVGLLTGSPSQVVRGGIIQGVKKLIKAQNNPDNIIKDIFNLQGKIKNVKTPIIKKPQKLLAPPSKEAIISESKKGIPKDIKRPGIVTPQEVQLAKQAKRQTEVKLVENDLNSTLNSKYNPNKIRATKEFIDRNITQGKITKEEAITLVENQYEKANGFDKPHYEKMLNDMYSNKKIESFDDLLNEKPVQNMVKTPRQEFLETPEGIYEEINKKANDRRFNPEKANALIAKFKEKTGIDLMKNPMQKFDEKGNVIRTIKNPIVKPNIIKNESKVSKPTAGDTIPDGYFKNAFGEIQKKPSNKKGGFINIPEIGKSKSPDSGLIEEALKYNSADEFIKSHNKKEYRSAHQLNNADSITADKIDLKNLKEAIRKRNGYLNNFVLKDLKKLEKLQNNPEGKITIYRASPKNELNEGDWVTTDKSYAQYIKKQNGGQVNSFDVYVKDLRFPNDLENLPSLQMATTFNYGPNIDKLTKIYEQATKQKSIIKK